MLKKMTNNQKLYGLTMVINVLVLLFVGSLTNGQVNQPQGTTLIRNRYAYMAETGLISTIAHDCIDKQDQLKKEALNGKSLETLIEYIERLEDVLANTTDPILSKLKSADSVARLLLHRFYLENVDFANMINHESVSKRADIDTQILGRSKLIEMDYYFPDYVYSKEEICTLQFMFAHVYLNNSDTNGKRRRRAIYDFNRNQKSSTYYQENSFHNLYPIQEKGVVSFRVNSEESISPAKVLIGVLAGLTENFIISGKEILKNLGSLPYSSDSTLEDPHLAVTLGNIAGSAIFYDSNSNNLYDENSIFGVGGKWVNTSCCNYYALTDSIKSLKALRQSSRGSLAQIRGALDGYIIAKQLKSVDKTNLRLSNILRSYYSFPRSSTSNNKLSFTYCDRSSQKPSSSELSKSYNAYSSIFSFLSGGDRLNSKANLFDKFLDRASKTQDFCQQNRPSGVLDKNTPCETSADLLFFVDTKIESITKTSSIINDIISKINKIGRYAGTISVFANSRQSSQNNVEMPHGPGSWPIPALVFNSSSIGSITCHINQESLNIGSQNNLGQFFLNLNKTILNYKWWTPRRFLNGVPSKNVIIIDYGTLQVPKESKEKSDYDSYGDSLVKKNKDVRYLVISNNQNDFNVLLDKKQTDLIDPSSSQIGTQLEKRICDNPATLTYNNCDDKTSDNAVHQIFVTPGYKQNWAIYPEYFLKSYTVEFKIRSVDGVIKYCWHRSFPPEDNDRCKELTTGSEETFKIHNPCHHEDVYSCSPIYLSIWGKEKTSPICNDVACQSLDQIKVSVSHTGISCNSSFKITATFFLQIVCVMLACLRYKTFV